MFLLIGVLLAIDILFLTVVTAVDQSRLRAVVNEMEPTVSFLQWHYYVRYVFPECLDSSSSNSSIPLLIHSIHASDVISIQYGVRM